MGTPNDDNLLRRLAIEQRKRLVASIMAHAEEDFFDRLTRDQQRAFRNKVLNSVGAYHDFMLDIIKVNRDDVLRSEESLNLIRQVHEATVGR